MDINAQNMKALYTGLSTAFNQRFASVAPSYAVISMLVKSTTQANMYPRFEDFPGIREWVGDRVVNELSGSSYILRNNKFEGTVGVSRDDIEDNVLGLYPQMAAQLGQEAAEFPDQLVWPLFARGEKERCSDGQYYFDADHRGFDANGKEISTSNYLAGDKPAWYLVDDSNVVKPMVFQERAPFKFTAMDKDTDANVFMKSKYLYGVDGRCNAGFGLWHLAAKACVELNEDNFSQVKVMMTTRRKKGGGIITIRPAKLIVPPQLETTARKLLKAELINGGDSNVLQNAAEIMVVPQLAA